jgi:hypothetical protein
MMRSFQASSSQPAVAPVSQAPTVNGLVRDQVRQAIIEAQKAVQDAGDEGGPHTVHIGPTPGLPNGITIDEGGNLHGGMPDVPPHAYNTAIGFMAMCAVMVIGWPIARALGRRIDRKEVAPAVNPAMSDQLQRIEQAVDAMSIEIERISESQRFMAKLQNADPAALPTSRS